MKVDKKVLALIVIMCVITLPIAFTLYSSKANLSSEATLFIDPPLLSFDTLVLGKRFSVNITVLNVTDLKSYELKLSYNSMMLDVVGVAFLPEVNLPVGNLAVNDTEGVIWMSTTYEGNPITTSGPIALATITFKMMNHGTCPLHLYETKMWNSTSGEIPHFTQDGTILILRHDVAITDLTLSTTETYVERIVEINVTAKNLGDVTENFTVKLYHNTTLLGSFDINNLGSGVSIVITFEWNTSDAAAGHNYEIKAEATTVSGEADTSNNLLVDGIIKVKIIGDINNDDYVDINDLNAWDVAYGSKSGDPNWNPQADINNDGIVDKADGMLIIENYHNTP
ncbi:MAG: cohesin domain-containing protein [Candidatus Bathyarchaeia archaeon]